MTPMLEKIARAIIDLDGRHGLAYSKAAADRLALRYARAALLEMREPDEAFMLSLYPDPEIEVADRGRAAGARSRRAGQQQIARFIDAILKEAGE